MTIDDVIKLFIVGKINPENHKEWIFQGVFDSKDKASQVCRDENYFIGPAVLNESLPHDDTDWPGAFYPERE